MSLSHGYGWPTTGFLADKMCWWPPLVVVRSTSGGYPHKMGFDFLHTPSIPASASMLCMHLGTFFCTPLRPSAWSAALKHLLGFGERSLALVSSECAMR